ncbi:hydrolase [Xylariaceae sp. FL1019]|nr:hydrolase [Xylariaceae sp. FL1019]
MRPHILNVGAAVTTWCSISLARVVPIDNTEDQNTLKTEWGAQCRDLTIPVHVAKTSERDFALGDYDIGVLFALIGREVLIDADYEISARFCEPSPDQETHEDTLQLLVHGSMYNKAMWDFPYKRDTYSWTRFMNLNGFATLAVDLVGAGKSTHPDGLLEAQIEVFVQTLHDIIQQLRTTTLLGKTFSQIAYVGFSVGAIVGNGIADRYPNDVDMLLFLGITWMKDYIYPVFMAGGQTAAAKVNPRKWGKLEEYYQTQPSILGREMSLYSGDYETGALEMDHAMRDTDTLGAAVAFPFHLVTATNYTGPVFLGIGENDGIFCGGSCGDMPYGVLGRFPQASLHKVKIYPRAGHALVFHQCARELQKDVLGFLNRQSSGSRARSQPELDHSQQQRLRARHM